MFTMGLIRTTHVPSLLLLRLLPSKENLHTTNHKRVGSIYLHHRNMSETNSHRNALHDTLLRAPGLPTKYYPLTDDDLRKVLALDEKIRQAQKNFAPMDLYDYETRKEKILNKYK